MKKVIYVPQGGYAKIIRATPENQNVAGFITAGMDTCCHVIIANRITGYMVLSHADALTNLEDSRHGVLAWIMEACSNGNYENLVIDIGENENNPRFGTSSSYLAQINNVLMTLRRERPSINVQLTYHGTNYQYGISIFRDANNLPFIEERNHQPNVLMEEEREAGRKIEMLEDERGTLEGKINRARGYIHDRDDKTLNQDTRFPPICIFDGSSDKLLDLEIIKNTCNQYGIEWEFVIDSNLPSSYGGSERGSELSEIYSSDSEHDSRDSSTSKISEIKEEKEVLINQLNQILSPLDMHTIEAGADGNCFFHAIARQLEMMNAKKIMTHEELRKFAIQYMLEHPNQFQGFTEKTLDDYIAEMSKNGTWADNPIMQALVNDLGISIDIFLTDGSITHLSPTNNAGQVTEPLRLAYTGNHYLSIESINTQNLDLMEDSIQEEIDSASIVSSSSSCNQKPSIDPTKAPTLIAMTHQFTDSEFVNNINQTTGHNNHNEGENIDISLHLAGLVNNQDSGEL